MQIILFNSKFVSQSIFTALIQIKEKAMIYNDVKDYKQIDK